DPNLGILRKCGQITGGKRCRTTQKKRPAIHNTHPLLQKIQMFPAIHMPGAPVKMEVGANRPDKKPMMSLRQSAASRRAPVVPTISSVIAAAIVDDGIHQDLCRR